MTEFDCTAVIDDKRYSFLTMNCHNIHQATQQFHQYLKETYGKQLQFATYEEYKEVSVC